MLALLLALDESGFLAGLYRDYHNLIYYIARQLLRDDYAAEDAAQTAWLKLIGHQDTLRGLERHKLKRYLVIVVRNVCWDLLRRERPEPLEDDALERLGGHDAGVGLDQEDILDIRAALAALPPNYRDALYLKYYLDLDSREIGELTGVSPENARQRLCRGIARLARQLAEGGGQRG